MSLKAASVKLSGAFAEFVIAVVGAAREEKGKDVTPAIVDEKECEEVSEFPKNFSMFRKHWEAINPENQGFLSSLFSNVSAVVWTPEKIEMVAMGAPEFETSATGPDVHRMVLDVLQSNFRFAGSLIIRAATSSVKKAPGRPKTVKPAVVVETSATETKPAAPSKVKEEDVRKACAELAKRLGSKEPVFEILEKFGSRKLAEIDSAHYSAIVSALNNYGETTTAPETENEF